MIAQAQGHSEMNVAPRVVTVLVSLFTLISSRALMLLTFESVGDKKLT